MDSAVRRPFRASVPVSRSFQRGARTAAALLLVLIPLLSIVIHAIRTALPGDRRAEQIPDGDRPPRRPSPAHRNGALGCPSTGRP